MVVILRIAVLACASVTDSGLHRKSRSLWLLVGTIVTAGSDRWPHYPANAPIQTLDASGSILLHLKPDIEPSSAPEVRSMKPRALETVDGAHTIQPRAHFHSVRCSHPANLFITVSECMQAWGGNESCGTCCICARPLPSRARQRQRQRRLIMHQPGPGMRTRPPLLPYTTLPKASET